MHILRLSFPKQHTVFYFVGPANSFVDLTCYYETYLHTYVYMRKCVHNTFIHMFVNNDLIDILKYICIYVAYTCIHRYTCMCVNMYKYIYVYLYIYVCVCVHIILLLPWLFLFTFFSLLLCLPFIVSLFLLCAYWWQNPAIFKYDIRLILFVNLN